MSKMSEWTRLDPEDRTTWPPFEKEVLATIKGVLWMVWLSYDLMWSANEWSDEPLDTVTAWMPLPEPFRLPELESLKPCPFCGGEAILMDAGYPHWVFCKNCGAKVHGHVVGETEGPAASVEAWNRRFSNHANCERAKLEKAKSEILAVLTKYSSFKVGMLEKKVKEDYGTAPATFHRAKRELIQSRKIVYYKVGKQGKRGTDSYLKLASQEDMT